jgi:hypothetical protein
MLADNNGVKNRYRLPYRVRLCFHNVDWRLFHPYGVVNDSVNKHLLGVTAGEKEKTDKHYVEDFGGHSNEVCSWFWHLIH